MNEWYAEKVSILIPVSSVTIFLSAIVQIWFQVSPHFPVASTFWDVKLSTSQSSSQKTTRNCCNLELHIDYPVFLSSNRNMTNRKFQRAEIAHESLTSCTCATLWLRTEHASMFGMHRDLITTVGQSVLCQEVNNMAFLHNQLWNAAKCFLPLW